MQEEVGDKRNAATNGREAQWGKNRVDILCT